MSSLLWGCGYGKHNTNLIRGWPIGNCHTIWRWNPKFQTHPNIILVVYLNTSPLDIIRSHEFPGEIPMNSHPPPACSVHFRPLGQQTCPSSKALLNCIASNCQIPLVDQISSETRFQHGPFCGDPRHKCIGNGPTSKETLRLWTLRKPSQKVSAAPAYVLANPELEFHGQGSQLILRVLTTNSLDTWNCY